MIKIGLVALFVFLLTVLATPFVKKIAFKYGMTDLPSARKVHVRPIPTIGGIAIFFSFIIGLLILQPVSAYHFSILIGALIIVLLGFFDDLYNLTARVKFIVQVAVALLVVFWGGLHVEFINLPFGGQLEFGVFSSLITVLWIVGITNA